MPRSPEAYADVVERMVEKATPRKQMAMERRGMKRKLDFTVVENIKATIKKLKKAPTNENRRTYYSLCKASTADRKARWSAGRHLGISWRVLQKTFNGTATVEKTRKKGYRGAVPGRAKAVIMEFWKSPEISKESPLKKGVKNGLPTYLLQMTYQSAFRRFRKTHPDINIGYVKFIALKPANVRHMRRQEREVCCCVSCENPKLKLNALNKLIVQKGADINLRINNSDLSEIADLTMCPYEYPAHPKPECLQRKCASNWLQ